MNTRYATALASAAFLMIVDRHVDCLSDNFLPFCENSSRTHARLSHEKSFDNRRRSSRSSGSNGSYEGLSSPHGLEDPLAIPLVARAATVLLMRPDANAKAPCASCATKLPLALSRSFVANPRLAVLRPSLRGYPPPAPPEHRGPGTSLCAPSKEETPRKVSSWRYSG